MQQRLTPLRQASTLAMKMTSCIFAALISMLLLSACDTIYGVRRQAPVAHVPNMTLLQERVLSYPEIDEAVLKNSQGGRPLTLSGIKPPSELQYLTYSGSEISGTLHFSTDYQGHTTYHQYHIQMNRRPPQPVIDAIWPIMLRIERDLEYDFGLAGLTSQAQTTARGVVIPLTDTTPSVQE